MTSILVISSTLSPSHSVFFSMLPPPPRSTPFPYTTLFRSRLNPPDASPSAPRRADRSGKRGVGSWRGRRWGSGSPGRSEEHTSELQSLRHLVCRLLLEKKK